MLLSNSLQVRILRSVVIDVVKVKAEHVAVAAVVHSNTAFNAQAKQFKGAEERDQKLGVRHFHSWNAILQAALTDMEDKPTMRTHMQEIQSYCQVLGSKGIHLIAAEVRHTRIHRPWDKANRHVEVSTQDQSLSQKVRQEHIKPWLLASKDAHQMQGIAPSGDLEKKLQTWLDENGMSSQSQNT